MHNRYHCEYWEPFSRVVLSEAVDWFICFTRKKQHGGDWERSRPQGPKNVYNFLMTVRHEHAGMELKCYWFLKDNF